MRIVYLANVRLPTEKAHGIQIMKMCEAFSKTEGVNVELVVPWRFNPIKEDPFLYYQVEKKFTITKIPSLDFIAFGKIGFLLQTFSFAFFASFYLLFLKHISVIYSRDELPLFFLGFFKRNIFLEIHTKKENFFAIRVLQNVRGIISITKGLKDFYTSNGIDEKNIFVAPDGVDVLQFNTEKNKTELRKYLNLPQNKKIIGYVGKYKTMAEPKGVDDLIVSFSEVLQSLPNTFLLLVGINKYEVEEVKKVFQSAGVGETDYKIVTHIPQREAFLYMKTADVLVMNYPYKLHYALYMSPLKLFEYMASGVPIITTDLPSVREILSEKNALIVKGENLSDLSKGLLSLLGDKEFATKLAKQAYQDVQKYTWDKRANAILLFIKNYIR